MSEARQQLEESVAAAAVAAAASATTQQQHQHAGGGQVCDKIEIFFISLLFLLHELIYLHCICGVTCINIATVIDKTVN